MCSPVTRSKSSTRSGQPHDGKKSTRLQTTTDSVHGDVKSCGFKGITLTPAEKELVSTLNQVTKYNRIKTVVRIAGGWVRDRLLGEPAKNDVDIALENMTGVAFSRCWDHWAEQCKDKDEKDKLSMHVIQKNPDRSKHLETG
jgi:hypothetical protein